MISIWSGRAKKSLHIVENYILREFGEDKRLAFMTEAEQVAISEHERVIISDIWDIRREPKTASKGL